MNSSALVKSLYQIQAVKFGDFRLKGDVPTPIYIDLRLAISYPDILRAIAAAIWEKVAGHPTDLICGVPYAALPLTTCLALSHNKPMVMARKEVKNYGTQKLIEGAFSRGQSCLLIEDVIVRGVSINETAEQLIQAGISVPVVAGFLDRQQGGRATIEQHGHLFFSAFTLTEFLDELKRSVSLDAQELAAIDRIDWL